MITIHLLVAIAHLELPSQDQNNCVGAARMCPPLLYIVQNSPGLFINN